MSRRNGVFAAAALAGLLAAETTLPAVAADTTLYALVAANATKPFTAIDAAFAQAHPGVTINPNFTGTQILQTQLENGAPCDVFVSADLAHIQKLEDEHLIEAYHRMSRLHEVIVVPKSNPGHVRDLRDLASGGVKLLIGVPDVPIGKYTREIFAKADRAYGDSFEKKALANVVSLEVNVKSLLQKVALDEADAAVVYRSDVDADALKAVDMIEIPAHLNVSGDNYIAVSRGSKNPALARQLMDYALSPAGQAVFAQFGYDPK